MIYTATVGVCSESESNTQGTENKRSHQHQGVFKPPTLPPPPTDFKVNIFGLDKEVGVAGRARGTQARST